MGLFDRLAISTLPLVPRPVMRRFASRYIAGEELEQALERLTELAARGFPGILDILGEDVADEADARSVVETYRRAARTTSEAGLEAYVSVKPTHVGLRLSEELCFEGFDQLIGECAALGCFVRVEMEDYTTTDATLRIFERLRRSHENVGLVLQSRLLRTPQDIENLTPGAINVRMVKGVYLEPPSIAHVDPEPIRQAFVDCTAMLFERGAFVAFATHDEELAARLLELVRSSGIASDRYEFQVLLGVREPLWKAWQDAGHRVRVYVPFGPEWRAYSTRRLRKNPQIFRHVIRDLVRFR